jgi:hypothetical protein
MLVSVFTINGTSYGASSRAAAAILPTSLERSLEGGYDTLTFWEASRNPAPTFHGGQSISLTIDIGDGNGAVKRFFGEITDWHSEFGALGWGHYYTALGPKYLADRVPVTAVDGTGTQVYNRTPDDEYYDPSDAGLALGTIFERILCIPATATALDAAGIGAYTTLSPPTLPASTLADLALLTVVPPRPVAFSGESIFNVMDQALTQWMPKFFSEINPTTGAIRFSDTTDCAPTTGRFLPQTLTCPSADGTADPVSTPRVRSSTRNCATRLVLRGGPEVEVATLSLLDGTLAEVFTSTDKTNWNLTYFTEPKGAADYGTITAVTSTSATLQSHDNTVTWATNFWSNNDAVLTMIDPLIAGVNQLESRTVTSNNAMTAGGTSTVNWDSTWPITGTTYSQYRITGGAGGLIDTWRTYTPCEPHTGATGTSTWIGSHLVVRSAHAIRVANAGGGFTEEYYTVGLVYGGTVGQSLQLGLKVDPSAGLFRFNQPTVTVFGQTSFLNTGSPTTAAQGKPVDVVIYALYSRGPLSTTVPPDIAGVPQYEGTAFTDQGLEVTKYLDFPDWLWANDTGSMTDLAQQHLDAMKNTEIDLDIDWMGVGAGYPAWDFLSFTYCLNVAIQGQTSPWSAINAPVRSISMGWDWSGQSGVNARISMSASTRRRAFSGDDLYLHPQFAAGSPLYNNTSNEEDHPGNYRAYGALVEAGYRASPSTPMRQASPDDVAAAALTPSQMAQNMGMGAPDSGFTMNDTLMAGMDNGGGIRDAATDPEARRERMEKRKRDAVPLSEAPKDLFPLGINDMGKKLMQDFDAGRDVTKTEQRQAERDREKAEAHNVADMMAANRGDKEREDESATAQRKAEAPEKRQQVNHDLAERALEKNAAKNRQVQEIHDRNDRKAQEANRAKVAKMIAGSLDEEPAAESAPKVAGPIKRAGGVVPPADGDVGGGE